MSTGLIRKRFRIDRGFDQLPVTTIKLSLPGINRGQFEPDSKRLRPTGRADQHRPRSNRMEFLMSIKSKIAALARATLAVTGSMASTTRAEAKGLGWGIGAGLVGAAIVGSAIAANDGYYHDSYRRCGWVRQFDAYGNYMGRVRTCNY